MKEPVETRRDGNEVCTNSVAGKREYNRRTLAMAERQDWLCAICGCRMFDNITFDHEKGRGMGGGKRDDRIEIDGKWHNAAVHWLCNGDKGSRRVAYIIVQDLTLTVL